MRFTEVTKAERSEGWRGEGGDGESEGKNLVRRSEGGE